MYELYQSSIGFDLLLLLLCIFLLNHSVYMAINKGICNGLVKLTKTFLSQNCSEMTFYERSPPP
jgi:hypothetical protein